MMKACYSPSHSSCHFSMVFCDNSNEKDRHISNHSTKNLSSFLRKRGALYFLLELSEYPVLHCCWRVFLESNPRHFGLEHGCCWDV